MDISVIIPVFNGAKYIKKAIESVTQQRGVEWELFLVDDGSTDETPEICDKIAKNNDRIYVIHKENEGPGIARNVAIDEASGKYIFFLDGDDWLVDGALAYLFELAEENSVDIVSYGVHKTTERELVVPLQIRKELLLLEGDDILRRYFTKMSASICKLFRREIFEKYRFEKKEICEDAWSMHLFFSEAKRIALCTTPCYVQFIGAKSRSRNAFSDKNFISIECGKRMVTFALEKRPQVYGEALYNLIKRQLKILSLILENKVYSQYRSEYYKIIDELKEERADASNYREIDKNVWYILSLALDHPFIFRFRERIKLSYYKWKKV